MERRYFRGPAITVSSPPAETSLTRRSLILLVVGLVTFGMGFSILFPLLPPLARQMGFSEFEIGVIFATGSVCLFICAPLWGRKSDLWGRKPILLIGFVGYGVGQLIFVVFIELGLRGLLTTTAVFAGLLASRIAFTALVAAVNGPASGYISDTTTRKDRTSALSWVNASFGLGSAVGPAIGGLLAGLGVLVPLYLISGWALLMAVMIWLLLPEPKVHRPTTKKSTLKMTDKRLLPVAILTVFSFFAITASLLLAGLYVQDRIGYNTEDTAQAVGGLLTVMAAAALFTQLFIIRRFRVHPYTLLVFGMPLGALGMLGITLSDGLVSFGAAFMFVGFAVGLVGPALSGMASLSVGQTEQGGVAGVVEANRAIGSFAASMGGTALYHIGPSVPFVLTAVSLALMSMYAFYLWNTRRRMLARQTGN